MMACMKRLFSWLKRRLFPPGKIPFGVYDEAGRRKDRGDREGGHNNLLEGRL